MFVYFSFINSTLTGTTDTTHKSGGNSEHVATPSNLAPNCASGTSAQSSDKAMLTSRVTKAQLKKLWSEGTKLTGTPVAGDDLDQCSPIVPKFFQLCPVDTSESDVVAREGTIIVVNCRLLPSEYYQGFDSKYQWYFGGSAAGLVRPWRLSDAEVWASPQTAADDFNECSGVVHRFPVDCVCMPETHLLYLGEKNAWCGVSLCNPQFAYPVCLVWTNSSRGDQQHQIAREEGDDLIRPKTAITATERAKWKAEFVSNSLLPAICRFDVFVSTIEALVELNHVPPTFASRARELPKHHQRFEILLLQFIPNPNWTSVKVWFVCNWRLVYDLRDSEGFESAILSNIVYYDTPDFHEMLFTLDSQLEEIDTTNVEELASAHHVHNEAVSVGATITAIPHHANTTTTPR